MTEAEIQSANIGLRLQVQELEQSVCQWRQRAEEAEALLEEIAKVMSGYTPDVAEKDILLKPNLEGIAYSSGKRKLTPQQTEEIRESFYDRGISVRMLASEYGVHECTIRNYIKGG